MNGIKFLGLRLDALSMPQSVERCERLIGIRGAQHVVLNAAKVVAAQNDGDLKNIINHCDMVNADGMSVVWGAKLLGLNVPERVAGIDLMHELVTLSSKKGYSIYLLGAKKEIVESTAVIFSNLGANVSGFRDGYWTDSEEATVVAEIASHKPDFLFIAIPSPQKEIFLSKHLEKLDSGLAMGVGGSFDVVAGLTARAPKIMQLAGLEWLFRLIQEPRRMLKRYLIGNTKFVILVLKALLFRLGDNRGSKNG